MKKQKLKLEDLKVQSFVTSLEKTQKQTIDGGTNNTCPVSISALSIMSSASAASASIMSAHVSTASAVVTPATSYVVSAAGTYVLTKEIKVIDQYNCACVTFLGWECWSSEALKG